MKENVMRALRNNSYRTEIEGIYSSVEEEECAKKAEKFLLGILYKSMKEDGIIENAVLPDNDIESRWESVENMLERFGFEVNTADGCGNWLEIESELGEDSRFLKEHMSNYMETEELDADEYYGDVYVSLAAVIKNKRYDKARAHLGVLDEEERQKFLTLWSILQVITQNSGCGVVDTEEIEEYSKNDGKEQRFITAMVLFFDESDSYASMVDISPVDYILSLYQMELLIRKIEKLSLS